MSGGTSNTNYPFEDDAVQDVNFHTNTSPAELMKGCTLPVDLTRIDPQWWDVDITPQSDKDHLTTYMGGTAEGISACGPVG